MIGFVFPSLLEKDVSSEIVVVTGGAGGIGKLMAQKMAHLGAQVVLLDKNEEALDVARREVNTFARKEKPVQAFAVDLSDRIAAYAAIEKVKEGVGNVTVLINNAGIVTGKTLIDSPDHLMELSMAVNATAHFWTVKAVLPAMIEADHGHIVTISSSAGLVGVPGLADYCACKHAVMGFDESMRLEMRKLGKQGVKTTAVCPFFIKTGMFEGAASKWPRLLPLLEPEYAAGKIVRAIRCNQQVLYMPLILHITPLLRAILPVPVFDEVADWFGVLDTMDAFKGRQQTHEKKA